MMSHTSTDAEVIAACSVVDNPDTAELVWLMQRATKVLAEDFDDLARREGLEDLRDCLVLSVIADGESRSQLEIARVLGIDKTTLVAILDRLMAKELIVRAQSPTDRRVRIPTITEEGCRVLGTVLAERDRAVAYRLSLLGEGEAQILRHALWRLATSRDADSNCPPSASE